MNFQEGQCNQISSEMSALLQILLWAELEGFSLAVVNSVVNSSSYVWHLAQMDAHLPEEMQPSTHYLSGLPLGGFLQHSWLGLLRVWTHHHSFIDGTLRERIVTHH